MKYQYSCVSDENTIINKICIIHIAKKHFKSAEFANTIKEYFANTLGFESDDLVYFVYACDSYIHNDIAAGDRFGTAWDFAVHITFTGYLPDRIKELPSNGLPIALLWENSPVTGRDCHSARNFIELWYDHPDCEDPDNMSSEEVLKAILVQLKEMSK